MTAIIPPITPECDVLCAATTAGFGVAEEDSAAALVDVKDAELDGPALELDGETADVTLKKSNHTVPSPSPSLLTDFIVTTRVLGQHFSIFAGL